MTDIERAELKLKCIQLILTTTPNQNMNDVIIQANLLFDYITYTANN